MDIASFIGIFGGIAVVMFGAFMGGSLGGLIDVPSMFITVGGSYMCLFLTYPLSYVIGIFKVIGKVFKVADYKEKEMVQKLVALSEKSRRTGLLALEEEIQDFEDDFLRTGLRNVIDGIDGAAIRVSMENELTQMEERHNKWISLVNAWATLAPGFGMLGTVIGLIGMLLNIEDKVPIWRSRWLRHSTVLCWQTGCLFRLLQSLHIRIIWKCVQRKWLSRVFLVSNRVIIRVFLRRDCLRILSLRIGKFWKPS